MTKAETIMVVFTVCFIVGVAAFVVYNFPTDSDAKKYGDCVRNHKGTPSSEIEFACGQLRKAQP